MKMTADQISVAIIEFEGSIDPKGPTYRRRRTMSVDLRKDPWPKVSVRDQIVAFLTK